MISSNPSIYEDDGATERWWLDQAGIMFDEYHLINYRVQKEDAQTIIQNASVIFLLGGDNTLKQNVFLMEYELSDSIKKSSAVVMGASAGAINMSAKWLCSKNFGYKVEMSSVYDGIGCLTIFPSCLILILKITLHCSKRTISPIGRNKYLCVEQRLRCTCKGRQNRRFWQ